jgi:general secretion pathway protein A
MYDQYFGFSESPFSITPDPHFFYTNPVYLEAYSNLRYGIEAKKGFIAVTGEVGTGKTTLLRKLMREFANTIHCAFIFNSDLTYNELLRVILDELGIVTKAKERLAMVAELNAYLIEQLEKGDSVCLLIDEAQNLSDESLEGLRLLSNLETDKVKLLQVVLIGQPELNTKLDQPKLRQLKQRIAIRCEIAPLKEEEVSSYINFRLRAANYQGKNLFHPDAVQQIAVCSKGIPRLINVICDNALLIAYAASQNTVRADTITEVARDLRLGLAAKPSEAKETIKVSALEPRHEIPVVEASPHAQDTKTIPVFRHNVKHELKVGVGVFLIILVCLAVGSFTNFKSSSTIPERPNPKANLNKEALLVTHPQPISHKADAEVGNAELQNKEIGFKPIHNRIIIQSGSTISQIASNAYGSNSVLGLDLINEFNPQIKNLNWIFAGQELFLPVLRRETLIRSQPDGSYRLIVSSFLTQAEAEESARRVIKEGYQVRIRQNRVSNDLLLHRLEIDGLETLDQATRTFDIGLKNQWLAFDGQPDNGNQRQRTRKNLSAPGNASGQQDRRYERIDESLDKRAGMKSDRRRAIWQLEGRWYVNGDPNKRTEIVSRGDGLEARNEKDRATRLEVTGNGDVRALDWENKLRGDVKPDKIVWENGTTWHRVAISR